jgi:hypothetical protein
MMPEADGLRMATSVGRWFDDTDGPTEATSEGHALERDLERDPLAQPGDGVQDTSSESPVEGEEPEEAESPSADPPREDAERSYQARFDALEQRHRELEATLQRFLNEQQAGPQETAPPFMTRPASTWTPQDLADIGRHAAKTEIERFAQEQEWRAQLNATALGAGNDYGSVVRKYVYENPGLRHDPLQMNFIRQHLDPLGQYMLGLVHEMHAKCGRDPIATIKAIRNGLQARLDGARDVAKAVNKRGREVQLGLMSGGRTPHGHPPDEDAWAGSDAEWWQRQQSRRGF